jgi:hypothetical protein
METHGLASHKHLAMENYKKEKCSKQHLKIDLGKRYGINGGAVTS